MSRIKNKTLLTFLLFFALVIWVKDYVYPSTWNYRITIEVETPEGIKTGSAVRQVQAYKNWPKLNPDVGDIIYKVFGEAVVVDLEQRGHLFALINYDSYYEVLRAFPPPNRGTHSLESVHYYKSLKVGTKDELKKGKPKLVTFLDPSEAKSIKPVLYGELDKIFGDNVKIKSIIIEITDNEVTQGNINRLIPEGAEKLNLGYNYFEKSKE